VVVTTGGPGDEPDGLATYLKRAERVAVTPYDVPKQGSARFARALIRSWASSYPVDLWKWRSGRVRALVNECIREHQPDVIVADFLFAVANVPSGSVPMVYFSHNVEYVIWKRLHDIERTWWRRAILALEWRKVRRREARACREASTTIAVSDKDRDLMLKDAPDARIHSIPTGVDIEYFQPSAASQIPGRLVFSGSMDWYPNEDAMTYFVESILPIIRRDAPHVTLTIVGRNPSPAVRALERVPGVHVTGTVDDVRPFLSEAELYIVPLRVGGGTRLKIFEALAMGKAVLSTTVGAEGLDVADGGEIELADTPEAFAARVLALLGDPARRHALGTSGRDLVERRYSWPVIAQAFESHLAEVINERRSAAAQRCAVVS
jgi:glycosyltransferase involved in cell wall biosynthesis